MEKKKNEKIHNDKKMKTIDNDEENSQQSRRCVQTSYSLTTTAVVCEEWAHIAKREGSDLWHRKHGILRHFHIKAIYI